jgi:hypothetical protein
VDVILASLAGSLVGSFLRRPYALAPHLQPRIAVLPSVTPLLWCTLLCTWPMLPRFGVQVWRTRFGVQALPEHAKPHSFNAQCIDVQKAPEISRGRFAVLGVLAKDRASPQPITSGDTSD